MRLTEWIDGAEYSPSRVLKTEMLRCVRGTGHLTKLDAIDECAQAIERALAPHVDDTVTFDQIQGLIHAEQIKCGLGLTSDDEVTLTQQIIDSFAE
jgi:hypothetical protein